MSKIIDVDFHGDWLGSQLALTTLPILLRSSADWGIRKASEKLVKIVKGHIDNQDLGWPQLASSTLSDDPRILVSSEDYRNAIRAWRSNYKYYAGVKVETYNSKGIRIVDYAVAHEFGLGVPMRPLWAPSIAEMGGASGVGKIVEAAIFNKIVKLRAKGFKIDYRL